MLDTRAQPSVRDSVLRIERHDSRQRRSVGVGFITGRAEALEGPTRGPTRAGSAVHLAASENCPSSFFCATLFVAKETRCGEAPPITGSFMTSTSGPHAESAGASRAADSTTSL